MKDVFLSGSVDEIRLQMQSNYDNFLTSTQKWTEMLHFDPDPQTGLSPKDILWKKNKAKLYRYVAPDGLKFKPPILFVYALINKPYILDLIPGMSLIEHLANQGFDVYLLDWGEFAWEDRQLNFGNLVHDYIARAVQKVRQISQCPAITMIGYCMGGTIASMYAALYPQTVKNMMLLATPIDFLDAGVASTWLKAPDYDADKVVNTYELIPKDFIDRGVKMLRPVTNYWATYTRLWKAIDEEMPLEAWKALNKWVNDNIDLPGEVYRQWIKDLYQQNKLVKNEFIIQRQRVELAKITSNLLVLAGEKDHLVLPGQARAAMDHFSATDKTYFEYPVGHGGLVFGRHAKDVVYPVISGWLASHS